VVSLLILIGGIVLWIVAENEWNTVGVALTVIGALLMAYQLIVVGLIGGALVKGFRDFDKF
jgi:Na+/phosphate symporter